jgi:hypothetical protein
MAKLPYVYQQIGGFLEDTYIRKRIHLALCMETGENLPYNLCIAGAFVGTRNGASARQRWMMPNQMNRFTQRASRILSLSQQAAERMKHPSIECTHLLIGMIEEGDGVAGRALRELGVDLLRLESLSEAVHAEMTPKSSGIPELSRNIKRVLELGVDEARRMGHAYIGTEHLLLGLARIYDPTLDNIWKQLGLTPEDIRRQVRRKMQDPPVVEPEPPALPPNASPQQVMTAFQVALNLMFSIEALHPSLTANDPELKAWLEAGRRFQTPKGGPDEEAQG